jgi:HPt (histidine-containing phosphotransfer) domain-containing protein
MDTHLPHIVLAASTDARMTKALEILCTELGPEAVVELIDAFLGDTPLRLREVQNLCAGPDQPTLQRAAHSIKGSASLFGAVQVETAARELEQLAAQRQTTSQMEVALRLHSAFDHTRTELERARVQYLNHDL